MYRVSFTGDFSRNKWFYLVLNKFEVFDKFKEFKALIQNRTNKKIKALRTCNGGQIYKNEFKEFYKKCIITTHKSTP